MGNRHRHLALACALAIAASLSPAPAQEPSPERPASPGAAADANSAPGAVVLNADEGPLVIPGEPPDLIFEFTAKVAGYVEPCG